MNRGEEMQALQIFNNDDFGLVRMVEVNGKTMFVGIDIALALGYKKPNDAITRHCKGYVKHGVPTKGGIQEMNVIPEGDIYRLSAKSELPGAEKFESWIFDEVIPSIRKTGTYSVQPTNALEALQQTVKVLTDHENRINKLDEKIDNEIRLTYNQAKEIQFAVSRKVVELLGGKGTEDYKNLKASYFQQLHRDLKERLGVPSYRDIRRLDFENAMAYIRAWLPKVQKSA